MLKRGDAYAEPLEVTGAAGPHPLSAASARTIRMSPLGDVVSAALGQALATGYHGLLRAPFADPVKGANLSRGCTEVRRPFRTALREERPTLLVWSIFGTRPAVASVRKVGRTSCRDACHHQRSPRVISIGAAKRVCGLKMEGPGKPHDIPIQRVAPCRAPSMIVRRDPTEPLGGGRKSVGCEEVDRGEIVRSNLSRLSRSEMLAKEAGDKVVDLEDSDSDRRDTRLREERRSSAGIVAG